MIKITALPAVTLCLLASLAAAQDISTQWADRVLREAQQERGPLQLRPTDVKFGIGGLYGYDSNIFLETDHEDSNSILIGFGNFRVDHGTQTVDLTLDAQAAWKEYIQDDDESGDEERVYGKIRYVTSNFEAMLAEFYRHEQDPIDAVFADRIERIVSNTVPRLSVDLLPITLEVNADLGIVRFMDEDFEKADNMTIRADFSVIYNTAGGYDLLLQAGWLSIDYRYETGAPSDVDGAYFRGGVRGQFAPTFYVSLLAGVISAEADDENIPGEGADDESGADVALNLRWEATPQLAFHADFTRTLGFTVGGTDSMQWINRIVLAAEWQAMERLKASLRFQYDTIETPTGNLDRDYMSVGPWFQYKYIEQMYLEAGGAFRTGEFDKGADYDDVVFQAGVVFTN